MVIAFGSACVLRYSCLRALAIHDSIPTPVFAQEFPASIIEANGRHAFEAIETMSGKKVPGQVWRKISTAVDMRMDDRIGMLVEQYRQMLRFLGEKGCLLNFIRPEVELVGTWADNQG